MLILLMFAGCMRADLETAIYADQKGRFTIEYPEGWSVTEGQSEIQFWNASVDSPDFDPTIKMALFDTGIDGFEGLKSALEQEGMSFDVTNEDTMVNDLPAMIRRGSFMGEYQIYYYDLNDSIIGFSAYYDSTVPGQKELVTKIQQSFKKS